MNRLLFIPLMIVILFAVGVNMVEAYTGECGTGIWHRHLNIICILVSIHEQNESIIEKLDWNNCAIEKHINRLSITECGEMP